MKQLLFLIFTYAYLEIPSYIGVQCLEKVQNAVISADGDNANNKLDTEMHISVEKRGSPYKRLPAWSVYYGKRSLEERSVGDKLSDNGDLDVDFGRSDTDNTQIDNVNDLIKEISKRPSFKRLHSWMSTYGKRSYDTIPSKDMISEEGEIDGDQDTETWLDDENTTQKWSTAQMDDDENKSDTLYETEDKRVPGWAATYGKRSPGWSATYGKRVPGWAATYGKRSPGWSATYGKRSPGWSATYGKRAPGWSATYGKRSPGWSATYGKRVPGWSATYGKRVPGWSATYGKRVPGWSATYGKRSPGWSATYGKRSPMWQAIYGKRSDNSYSLNDNLDSLREQLNSANSDQEMEKRRGVQWGAFYGK